jgi:hypothetical protein
MSYLHKIRKIERRHFPSEKGDFREGAVPAFKRLGQDRKIDPILNLSFHPQNGFMNTE